MGKRELLLVAVFALVGFGVYRFTAPPADPSKPGFSFSRLLDNVRREIRGQRESAEGRKTITLPVAESVREIRLAAGTTAVTIVGEDRKDIQAELFVRSSGYDKAEAEGYVRATHDLFKSDEAGALLILTVGYPSGGRQSGTLTLKVPAHLGLRLDGKSGTFTATNLASIAIGTSRGATTISKVSGAVSINQRGAALMIDDVGSLRLQTAAGVNGRISNVKEDTTLNLQGGELRGSHFAGGLEVEARNVELILEQLDKVRGPVRINAAGGELTVRGLRAEARIDGRATEIIVDQLDAVPLAIYNEGSDPVELTTPAGGFKLDALAVNGSITLDEKMPKDTLVITAPAGEGQPDAGARRESRASGSVRGGGPTITIRASRGGILLKGR